MKELLIREDARAAAYKALADYYRPPDDEFLQRMNGLARRVGGRLGQVAESLATVDIEQLKVDHARLFVGPFELVAPPYGSVYLEDKSLMGHSTADVQDRYRQEGVEVTGEELPDHVVTELEFMHVLILKAMAATEAGDSEAACQCRQRQKTFLATHLGAWVVEFAERIQRGAQTEFYKALGRATECFVREDLERLQGVDSPV